MSFSSQGIIPTRALIINKKKHFHYRFPVISHQISFVFPAGSFFFQRQSSTVVKLEYFTNRDFHEIMGFPFLSYLLG